MDSDHPSILPTLGRMLLGSIWIAGAMVNAIWTLPESFDAWEGLSEDATFAGYRWFFGTVVGAAPDLMTLLLIAGELGLGVMVLSRDPWAEVSLVLSVTWCSFLFFIIWPYTLTTVVLLALSGWLLRYDHNRSVLDLFRHQGMPDRLHRVGA